MTTIFQGAAPAGTVFESEIASFAGGTLDRAFFQNGFGVSVLTGGIAYGGLELAVLEGTPSEWDLTFDTDITDDIIGGLDEFTMDEVARKVASLDVNGHLPKASASTGQFDANTDTVD